MTLLIKYIIYIPTFSPSNCAPTRTKLTRIVYLMHINIILFINQINLSFGIKLCISYVLTFLKKLHNEHN